MMIHGDPEFVLTLHSVLEFIGTFAFALSGIRLAASKHYDWLGGFVCGVSLLGIWWKIYFLHQS